MPRDKGGWASLVSPHSNHHTQNGTASICAHEGNGGILLIHSISTQESPPAATLTEPHPKVSLFNSKYIPLLCERPDSLSVVLSLRVSWGREFQHGYS